LNDLSDPETGYSTASNVAPGPMLPGSGVVYQDNDPFTIVKRLKTTPSEDAAVEKYLKAQLGNTGPYNRYSNSCREYSQTEFKKIERRIEAGRERQFGLPLF